MSDYKLQIKDGNGDGQELYVDSGSQGLVPYHKISGSVSAVISNFPATQSVAFATSSALTASILNLPATQSVSLVNTGSLTASLSATDLATLTSSISDVSSAIAHSLDKFIAGLLDNGSSSFSVDIVAGDVNTLTQSIGYVKDEVAKLTALSSSFGLKTYTKYATSTTSNIPTLANAKIGNNINQDPGRLGYIVSNQSDASLYIGLDNLITNLPSMATIILFPGETYESSPQNAQMKFAVKLDSSAASGTYSILETF